MDLGQYLTAFHVKHIQQVTKTRKRALVAYFDTITQMRPEKSNPESAFLSIYGSMELSMWLKTTLKTLVLCCFDRWIASRSTWIMYHSTRHRIRTRVKTRQGHELGLETVKSREGLPSPACPPQTKTSRRNTLKGSDPLCEKNRIGDKPSRISDQLESVSETITFLRDVNKIRESLDPDWSTDENNNKTA